MTLYRFREEGGARLALTMDPWGERLPRGGRVWQYLGALEPEAVARIGASVEDILEAVRAQGYFLWPPTDD